jgi:hypothetical protein
VEHRECVLWACLLLGFAAKFLFFLLSLPMVYFGLREKKVGSSARFFRPIKPTRGFEPTRGNKLSHSDNYH